MTIKLGCIADDFTGATDLANNLVRAGMRAVQTIGIPTSTQAIEADAIVVALKSRTAPVAEAIAESLQALHWLKAQGAQQIYFKYCSTFDSTAQGNIGPVLEALMAHTGCDFTIATPAFPDNGRTVFKGYLFVGDALLNESGMQHHPLTPMHDANLVRVLQEQVTGKVGLVDYKAVTQHSAAIKTRFNELKKTGVAMAIIDATSNDDLMRLGLALKGMPLVSGGSGVAIGLPQNFGIAPSETSSSLPGATGYQAIVSGSCSAATQRQVADFIAKGLPVFQLDPDVIATGSNSNSSKIVADVMAWAKPQLSQGPVLVYSTDNPERVKQAQSKYGVAQAGEMMENALAQVACGLVKLGVKQLITAGGETSGACVKALEISQLRIGPQIDTGVPWCYSEPLHIALKSGNFGGDDFFTRAFTSLKA